MTARQALGRVLQGQAAFASTQDEEVCWKQAMGAMSTIKIKDDYEPLMQPWQRPILASALVRQALALTGSVSAGRRACL
jgi:hypothetical protein